jgi:hypothetical protein
MITGGLGGGAGNGGGDVNSTTSGISVAVYPGTAGSAPGGGTSGAWARNNSALTPEGTSGNPGANGQVIISFNLSTVPTPSLAVSPGNACSGDQVVFSVVSPITGIDYEFRKKVTSGADIVITTLTSLNPNFTLTADVADTGDYYLFAEYRIYAPGAVVTSTDLKVLGTLSAPVSLTVHALHETPQIFWSFDGICPIDESAEDNINIFTNGSTIWDIRLHGGATPPSGYYPDSTNFIDNYFANYIDWDSIVYLPSYPGLNIKTDLIWYDDETGGNILKAGGILTSAGYALQAIGKFSNFWQNEPHEEEIYWVSIAGDASFCESPRRKIRVFITDDEATEALDICLTYYTREGETISWTDVVKSIYNVDDSYQELLWFSTENNGTDFFWNRDRSKTIPEPAPIDLTNPLEEKTYWTIRADDLEDVDACMTYPFGVSVTVLKRPDAKMWINTIGNNIDTLCVGTPYNIILQIEGGTSPWVINGNGPGISWPITIKEDDFNLGIGDSCYVLLSSTATAASPPQIYNFNITAVTVANPPCLVADPQGYVYQYPGNAQLTVFGQPAVGNIAPVNPVCGGGELIFPSIPAYNSNSGSAYTSGWMLGRDIITAPYIPTIDDNGKSLFYFVSNRCETDYSNYVTVQVGEQPEISVTRTTICSGDTLHIQLNDPTISGTYESSDPDIAFVSSDGIIYTDVNIIAGIPVPRPPYDSKEGLGGTVTITYTSSGGCTSHGVIITVNPRTQTPDLRWTYDGICPVEESDEDEIWAWIDTTDGEEVEGLIVNEPPCPTCVPDSTNHVDNYFANYIRWDFLINNGISEDDPDFYDPEQTGITSIFANIIWYDAPTEGNILKIDGELTPAGEALQAIGKFVDFWQNEPHDPETYWAALQNADSCESHRIRVLVDIYDAPGELQFTDFAAYVQPGGELKLWDDYLNTFIHLDASQRLKWYETEEDAYDDEDIPEPDPFDLTIPIDTTFWLVRADDYDCRSKPTPFRIRLFSRPVMSFEPSDTTVCAGGTTPVRLLIKGGTPPFSFKITNSNTEDIISESGYYDDTYLLPIIPPLNAITYYLSEFSGLYTDSVTYLPYGLFPPAGQTWFAETNISVIISEISLISPDEGPVLGGTFTGNPSNPIDPNGTITIRGHGFDAFAVLPVVMFDETAATNVTVVNPYEITCTPPPHASGFVTVSVITECGTFTKSNVYLYSSMDITDVSLAYAPVTGGTTVTIQGVGFLAGSSSLVTVKLCEVPATVVSVNDKQIVCKTGPSNFSKIGSIEIFNGSETLTFANLFTYYPVTFIKNGVWSEPYNWETQTDDRILPYPDAVIHIKANCLQDIDLLTGQPYPNGQMDSITVYPNKSYTLDYSKTLDANVFTLKDDASFLSFGTIQAIQQNVEHLLTRGRNWYVSNPVQPASQTMNDALGSGSNGGNLTTDGTVDFSSGYSDWRVEEYEEGAHNWQRMPLGSSLTTGLGYTVFSANEDIAVKFSGMYNNSNKALSSLSRKNDAHPKRGFNLVGNPFPSYWRWTVEAASSANVYSTIWYRTNIAGAYEFWSYNASGDVAVMPGWEAATPTGSYSLAYIPPAQAFWVRIMDGQTAGTITFANNRRGHVDHGSNILKSAGMQNTETPRMLRITVNNGVKTDETLIYTDSRAKKEFDTYDSDKWFVNQGVEIFTLPVSSTRELVINGLPEITDGTEIKLGFSTDEGGEFSFRAKEIINFSDLNVFLSDKLRNTEFDLRSGNYNFTSSAASLTDRFSIIFRKSLTGIDLPAVEPGDYLWAYSDKYGQMSVMLNIRDKQGSRSNVSIFDITGRKVAEQPVIAGEHSILNGTFQKGVYVLRSGKCVAKVIVK